MLTSYLATLYWLLWLCRVNNDNEEKLRRKEEISKVTWQETGSHVAMKVCNLTQSDGISKVTSILKAYFKSLALCLCWHLLEDGNSATVNRQNIVQCLRYLTISNHQMHNVWPLMDANCTLLGYRGHHSICYTGLFTTLLVLITISPYNEFWLPDVLSRGGPLMSSVLGRLAAN
jgi:hypothetical protein